MEDGDWNFWKIFIKEKVVSKKLNINFEIRKIVSVPVKIWVMVMRVAQARSPTQSFIIHGCFNTKTKSRILIQSWSNIDKTDAVDVIVFVILMSVLSKLADVKVSGAGFMNEYIVGLMLMDRYIWIVSFW